ncbi:MAG TPA: TatD family hydrolase [Verrucomicrobiae bacterium]|jgi:TatD DNase family protein|nr:TatD family hydrolase [Verrucomicrobiae bacterium]
MASFYDTHAHLGFPDFQGDLAETIHRAQDSGITKIISIGTDFPGSVRAIEIAEKFPNVYAAVGWHPTHVMDAPEDLRPRLRELAQHPKVVAIGETGLDYHRTAGDADFESYKRRQLKIFQQQMEVASELGLNCIIHQRDSFEDTLAAIKPFAGKTRGVFHCFSESADAMRRVFEIGCLVSFTGIVTFKNGANVRETLAAADLGQFMLETDCPFLAPVPFRGKRCEPGYVSQIAEVAAQVKHCSAEELGAATCRTAHEFFPKLGKF